MEKNAKYVKKVFAKNALKILNFHNATYVRIIYVIIALKNAKSIIQFYATIAVANVLFVKIFIVIKN